MIILLLQNFDLLAIIKTQVIFIFSVKMSARKRHAPENTELQPPPLKIRPTTTNGLPRLDHNGRLALICFLAHRSHRPTTPEQEVDMIR
jgi:hypothetical protein